MREYTGYDNIRKNWLMQHICCTLQHTATHRNTPQRTAILRNRVHTYMCVLCFVYCVAVSYMFACSVLCKQRTPIYIYIHICQNMLQMRSTVHKYIYTFTFVLHKYVYTYIFVYSAYIVYNLNLCTLLWVPQSDIRESSLQSRKRKLVGLFSLKRDKRNVRFFASSFAKSFLKCHFRWDRQYSVA